MPLLDITLDGEINKEKKAIERIKSFEPISNGFMDDPFFVAYSGGKDGDVIRILCELAGIPYELHHNHTTVDAPETVRYIRSIPDVQIDYPGTSMWREIEYYGLPTRLYRWCCSVFKEGRGDGRFVMTGVRWAESRQRRERNSVELVTKRKKDKIVLSADNDESRRMMENCVKKGIRTLNPIIDWDTSDVWEFLNYYKCESNPLYYCGFERIGCIGCPNAAKQRELHWQMWPQYKENYIRAAQRYIDKHPGYRFQSGEEMFAWWMSDKNLYSQIEGQELLGGWDEDQYDAV